MIRLDHLVLTARNLDATVVFDAGVLGMEPRTFGDDGGRAARPTPGPADFCFLTDEPLTEIARRLEAHGRSVLEEPV